LRRLASIWAWLDIRLGSLSAAVLEGYTLISCHNKTRVLLLV
jgi:hypothetical protein